MNEKHACDIRTLQNCDGKYQNGGDRVQPEYVCRYGEIEEEIRDGPLTTYLTTLPDSVSVGGSAALKA